MLWLFEARVLRNERFGVVQKARGVQGHCNRITKLSKAIRALLTSELYRVQMGAICFKLIFQNNLTEKHRN